jgi:hypothetical protein
MVSGIDRSIELDWLARPLSGPISHKSDRQKIFEHELDAMEKLDVPVFTSSIAGLDGQVYSDPDLELLCSRRDASVVQERLAHLSRADREQQVGTIKQAIEDRFKSGQRQAYSLRRKDGAVGSSPKSSRSNIKVVVTPSGSDPTRRPATLPTGKKKRSTYASDKTIKGKFSRARR